MMNSKGPRKLFLAVAAAAFLTVAGCSNKATDEAANQPAPKVPAKKAIAKPAAAKPVAPKTAAAKPAAKNSGKVVAAKSPAAKPSAKTAAATSKVMPSATLVTVPKGTTISATVGQALASSKNHSGDTFAAVLSSSIKVDGKTVIPKGTHITGRVVTAKKKSPPELTVALSSVDINGKSYKLPTEPINRAPKTQAKNDSGDADAAKAEKDISLPAQTRLKFMLAKPVKIPVKS